MPVKLLALGFLGGVLLLGYCADLPSPAFAFAAIPCIVVAFRYRSMAFPAAVVAGFCWGLWWASTVPQIQLPAALEGVDLTADGWVTGLPERRGRATRFEFRIASLTHQATSVTYSGNIRLSWYESAPPLRAGDRWRLTVRLKRPRGFINPAGFDYERWLYHNGIHATGYVRQQPAPQRLMAAESESIDRLRQDLAKSMQSSLAGDPMSGVLIALAVGDRQGIDRRQWQVFRRTGTAHLMAISGLHIGLVAGLLLLAGRFVWSWLPGIPARWPAPRAAAIIALIGASGYALLAGFSLPTQRALAMLAIALLAVLWRRPLRPGRVLATALLVVLLLDPFAPLSGGFWLSFAAVGGILYLVVGSRTERYFGRWLWLQLAVFCALLVPSLTFFQNITLLAPVANLIAIPWASFTVVPLTLLAALAGTFSVVLQHQLLSLAALTMAWLWEFLSWLAAFSWSEFYAPAPPLWSLLFAVPGIALLLAPRGVPGRLPGVVLCLPLLAPIVPPASGSAHFTLLDTGRGVSAVVRTTDHVLVYDTGSRMGSEFDAAQAALIPYLRQLGVRRIDLLVVSHADGNHSGGVRSLLAAMPVARIVTGDSDALPIAGAEPCRRGESLQWDGVTIELLHPPDQGNWSGGDASCVVRVATSTAGMLLAGDIGKRAQAWLHHTAAQSLPADILLAPDHGEAAPDADFLAAVAPRFVLFATGYRNRYGHPKADTVAAYQATGAELLNTARTGAVHFELEPGTPVRPPLRHRQLQRSYWHTP